MSVEETLAERGKRYGDFANHALMVQSIKFLLRFQYENGSMEERDGWKRMDAVKRQALEAIADKIARILTGDPNYADNWHDIQGYAKLVEDRL